MFTELKNKIKVLTKVSTKDILYALFLDKNFTDLIIDLNTKKQLFEQGVNSEDVLLSRVDRSPSPTRGQSQGKVYAVNTEQGIYGVYEGKLQLGLPVDHVTLFQHGDFYKSFKTFWNGSEIQIQANTIKDGEDLINRWGKEIIGLNEESLGELRNFTRNKLKQIVVSKIAA